MYYHLSSVLVAAGVHVVGYFPSWPVRGLRKMGFCLFLLCKLAFPFIVLPVVVQKLRIGNSNKVNVCILTQRPPHISPFTFLLVESEIIIILYLWAS